MISSGSKNFPNVVTLVRLSSVSKEKMKHATTGYGYGYKPIRIEKDFSKRLKRLFLILLRACTTCGYDENRLEDLFMNPTLALMAFTGVINAHPANSYRSPNCSQEGDCNRK